MVLHASPTEGDKDSERHCVNYLFFLALDGGSSGHSYDVSETISSSPTAHSYDGLGQSQEASPTAEAHRWRWA